MKSTTHPSEIVDQHTGSTRSGAGVRVLATVLWFALGALVAAGSIAVLWWFTIPKETGPCPAVIPAPPGCAPEARVPVATLWTALIVLVAVLHSSTASIGRLREKRWPMVVAGVALLAVALIGIRAVVYIYG